MATSVHCAIILKDSPRIIIFVSSGKTNIVLSEVIVKEEEKDILETHKISKIPCIFLIFV